MSKNGKTRMQWLAVAAALTLAAGCAEEPTVELEEPTSVEAQAVVLPASAATTAALHIAAWRYQPTEDGVVVRGLANDAASTEASLVSFWIAPGDTADEMVARVAGAAEGVTILREGGTRGGSDQLRAAVTAFRADMEAADKSGTKSGGQNVNDNVSFCYGNSATFSTWSFWATTKIRITNYSSTTWVQFSYRAGAFYMEQWVPPNSAPIDERAWAAIPVTMTYMNYNGGPAPCVNVRTW